MSYKYCKKCKQIKNISEFYKYESSKDGYRVYCKSCWIKYQINRKQNKTLLEQYAIKEMDRVRIKIKRQNMKPWERTYEYINSRCRKEPYYVKRNIKNYLNIDDLRYLWFRDKGYLLCKPSIDRINVEKDYILDNCRYIEHIENCRKKKININKRV